MRKIDADSLPFMNANLAGLKGSWEMGYNACLKTIQKQIRDTPIIKEIELSNAPIDGMYQAYYNGLYNRIREALGEERYKIVHDEALSSNYYGRDTIIVSAIEKLREDAGDFD